MTHSGGRINFGPQFPHLPTHHDTKKYPVATEKKKPVAPNITRRDASRRDGTDYFWRDGLLFCFVRMDSDGMRVARGGCGAKAPPPAARPTDFDCKVD